MARYFGTIGYGEAVETLNDEEEGTGIWVDNIVEFSYYGDVLRNTRRLESNDQLNSDIVVGNSISIVADQYAIEHFFSIRYIRWEGVAWTVTNVEVQQPRLILTLGNVYNGPFPTEEV